MKKFVNLSFVLVLTASLLMGCGCTKTKPAETSAPTILPTNEEAWNEPETTMRPTTEPEMTMAPTETFDRGNGPLEDTTASTENTENNAAATNPTGSSEARSRSIMPKTR